MLVCELRLKPFFTFIRFLNYFEYGSKSIQYHHTGTLASAWQSSASPFRSDSRTRRSAGSASKSTYCTMSLENGCYNECRDLFENMC